MPECQYCRSILVDKASLNNHQRRSKYCIKLREQTNPAVAVESSMFECEFCKKVLTSKHRLNTHIMVCKVKQKKEKEETNTIEQLRKEINQLKEKPSTTTITVNNTDNSIKSITNHYSSLLDCTPESITETFKKHYHTIQHLLESDQKHLADITVQHLLSGKNQPMYYVTDRSRNKFMYTDQENNEKEDANANLLRKMVYKGLKPIVNNLYEKQLINLNNDLSKYLRRDDGNMIASIRDEIKDLEESFRKANILKEGDDYVSQLSKCLPTSIKDRLYHDSMGLEEDEESDVEFHQKLKREMRMIGGYTVNELRYFKQSYKENSEVYLPCEIRSDPKYDEILAFIKSKE